jgi:hypothetical protein
MILLPSKTTRRQGLVAIDEFIHVANNTLGFQNNARGSTLSATRVRVGGD